MKVIVGITVEFQGHKFGKVILRASNLSVALSTEKISKKQLRRAQAIVVAQYSLK